MSDVKVLWHDRSLCSSSKLSARQIAHFLQTIPARNRLSPCVHSRPALCLCPCRCDLNSIARHARTTLSAAPSNWPANFAAVKQSANWLDKAGERANRQKTFSCHESIHWHTHKIGNEGDVWPEAPAADVVINNNNNNNHVCNTGCVAADPPHRLWLLRETCWVTWATLVSLQVVFWPPPPPLSHQCLERIEGNKYRQVNGSTVCVHLF